VVWEPLKDSCASGASYEAPVQWLSAGALSLKLSALRQPNRKKPPSRFKQRGAAPLLRSSRQEVRAVCTLARKNVAGLDVPVNDLAGVQVLEAACHVPNDPRSALPGEVQLAPPTWRGARNGTGTKHRGGSDTWHVHKKVVSWPPGMQKVECAASEWMSWSERGQGRRVGRAVVGHALCSSADVRLPPP